MKRRWAETELESLKTQLNLGLLYKQITIPNRSLDAIQHKIYEQGLARGRCILYSEMTFIRLNKDLKVKVSNLAKVNAVSRAEMIRRIIKEYKGKRND